MFCWLAKVGMCNTTKSLASPMWLPDNPDTKTVHNLLNIVEWVLEKLFHIKPTDTSEIPYSYVQNVWLRQCECHTPTLNIVVVFKYQNETQAKRNYQRIHLFVFCNKVPVNFIIRYSEFIDIWTIVCRSRQLYMCSSTKRSHSETSFAA